MTTRGAIFENFATPQPTKASKAAASRERLEDEKLAAFDAGYKSGWDDAISAYTDGRQVLAETLTKAISKAEIDLRDAKSQMLSQVLPLTEKWAEVVFGDGTNSLIANRLVQVVKEQTQDEKMLHLVIECSEQDLETLTIACKERNLHSQPTVSTTLKQGQFSVKYNDSALEMDFPEIRSNLKSLLAEFKTLHEENS